LQKNEFIQKSIQFQEMVQSRAVKARWTEGDDGVRLREKIMAMFERGCTPQAVNVISLCRLRGTRGTGLGMTTWK
jgi:hypothetical protein